MQKSSFLKLTIGMLLRLGVCLNFLCTYKIFLSYQVLSCRNQATKHLGPYLPDKPHLSVKKCFNKSLNQCSNQYPVIEWEIV